jgi:hypothetical protein
MDWVYSPIPRTYTIDYNTRWIREGGNVTNVDEFISYTENSVSGNVYTILVDGGSASYIVEGPFFTQGVRGRIYGIQGNTVQIRDAEYYDTETGRWRIVSATNNTMVITAAPNAIVGKNNNYVTAASLAVGDFINVYSNELPPPAARVGGMGVTAYGIFVTR